MKIRLLMATLSLFAALPALAQKEDQTSSARVMGSSVQNPYREKKKPQGSPYSQNTFLKAAVPKVKLSAFMRYNIYTDEFEFITPKNDTLILDKTEDFAIVRFEGINKNYELTAYTRGKKLEYGYLLETYEKNGWMLFRKENIGFTEEKVAKTTLEMSMPAKYTKLPDSFFIRPKDATAMEFPDGKKALLKAFPSKKDALEAYLKDNKVDFSDANDLKRVVDVLAQ